MNKSNKLLKDISAMASSTFSTMVNMKDEISRMIKEQIKSSLKKMDFVTKAEFNALKKIVLEMQESKKSPKSDENTKTSTKIKKNTKVK